MAEDRIDSYIDRAGVKSDTDFMLKQLNELLDLFNKVNAGKITIGGASSIRDISTSAKSLSTDLENLRGKQEKLNTIIEEGVKARARRVQSEKAVMDVINQRFASEAKLVTIQTDYNKQTTANRLEIQKQNKELKNSIELRDAESGSIEKARARIKVYTEERNKLNLFTKEGQLRLIELNAAIDKNGEFIRKNGDAYLKQKLNIGNYQGSAKIVVDALSEVEKKLDSLKQKQSGLQNLSAQNPVGFKLGNQANELNQVTAQIKQTEKEFAALSQITQDPKFLNLAAKVGDARTEIRGFTRSLLDLENAGLKSSDTYKQIQSRLAQLTDQVGDTRQEIKALSSDSRGFDILAGGINTVVSSYQTVVGLQALFADSNQDVQRSIQTLVAVQNVANGAREIANELTKKGTLANKAFEFVQTQYKIAADASAASTLRFGAALKFIGVGLIVSALAFLITKLGSAKSETDLFKEKLDALKKTDKEAAAALDELGKTADEVADNYIKKLKEETKGLNDALGITQDEANKTALVLRTLGEEKERLQKEFKDAQGTTFLSIGIGDDGAKQYADKIAEIDNKVSAIKSANLNKEILQAAKAGSEKVDNYRKSKIEELNIEESVNVARLKSANATEQEIFNVQQGFANQRIALLNSASTILNGLAPKSQTKSETDKELKNEQAKLKIAQYDFASSQKKQQEEDAKQRLEKQKEYADRERKAQFEYLKLQIQDRINAEKETSTSGLSNETERVQARFRAFEQEMALIDAEKNFALSSAKLTGTERLVIEKEAANKLLELEKQVADDVIQIRSSIREKLKQDAEDNKAGAEQFIREEGDRQIAEEQRLFNIRLANIEKQGEKELAANALDFEQGKKSKEQYETEKLGIENRIRRESLLAEIEYQKNILSLLSLTPEQTLDAETKLNDLRKQLRADNLKDEEDAVNKRIDLEKRKKEALEGLANELKDTLFTVIEAGFENEKNAIQENIDALEKKKAKDIEVANQTIANVQDRAAAIQVIEARAAAEREALERQKRAADEKKARFERAKNIAEIIGNTAKAISEAVAESPLTFGLPWSAFAAATGAAQLVRVLATPIPKYRHGKRKGEGSDGLAMVDDGGKPEAIIREGGDIEIGGNTPRITYLKKNDVVLPDIKDLSAMQLRMAIDQTGRLIHGYNQPAKENRNVEKAINRLGGRIENAVKNIPQPVIKNNVIEQWVRGNDSINSLNRYR